MNNPIPQCAPDSPEWAFRATEMINALTSLRDALEWWMECTEGFEPNVWTFWLMDEAMDELLVTCQAAWDEMLRALEETK